MTNAAPCSVSIAALLSLVFFTPCLFFWPALVKLLGVFSEASPSEAVVWLPRLLHLFFLTLLFLSALTVLHMLLLPFSLALLTFIFVFLRTYQCTLSHTHPSTHSAILSNTVESVLHGVEHIMVMGALHLRPTVTCLRLSPKSPRTDRWMYHCGCGYEIDLLWSMR